MLRVRPKQWHLQRSVCRQQILVNIINFCQLYCQNHKRRLPKVTESYRHTISTLFSQRMNSADRSLVEEVIPIREVRFLPLLIVSFGPGLSNGSLHVLVSVLVHLLHHVHQTSTGVFHLLFFVLVGLELHRVICLPCFTCRRLGPSACSTSS